MEVMGKEPDEAAVWENMDGVWEQGHRIYERDPRVRVVRNQSRQQVSLKTTVDQGDERGELREGQLMDSFTSAAQGVNPITNHQDRYRARAQAAALTWEAVTNQQMADHLLSVARRGGGRSLALSLTGDAAGPGSGRAGSDTGACGTTGGDEQDEEDIYDVQPELTSIRGLQWVPGPAAQGPPGPVSKDAQQQGQQGPVPGAKRGGGAAAKPGKAKASTLAGKAKGSLASLMPPGPQPPPTGQRPPPTGPRTQPTGPPPPPPPPPSNRLPPNNGGKGRPGDPKLGKGGQGQGGKGMGGKVKAEFTKGGKDADSADPFGGQEVGKGQGKGGFKGGAGAGDGKGGGDSGSGSGSGQGTGKTESVGRAGFVKPLSPAVVDTFDLECDGEGEGETEAAGAGARAESASATASRLCESLRKVSPKTADPCALVQWVETAEKLATAVVDGSGPVEQCGWDLDLMTKHVKLSARHYARTCPDHFVQVLTGADPTGAKAGTSLPVQPAQNPATVSQAVSFELVFAAKHGPDFPSAALLTFLQCGPGPASDRENVRKFLTTVLPEDWVQPYLALRDLAAGVRGERDPGTMAVSRQAVADLQHAMASRSGAGKAFNAAFELEYGKQWLATVTRDAMKESSADRWARAVAAAAALQSKGDWQALASELPQLQAMASDSAPGEQEVVKKFGRALDERGVQAEWTHCTGGWGKESVVLFGLRRALLAA